MQNRLLRWIIKHRILTAFFTIVLLLVGVLIYERVALELNKRAFAQARSTIDTIYADIVAQVGQPDNYSRTNECSRPSQEFEQGPLGCSVSTDFIYGVNNKQQADELKSKIQNVIKMHQDLLNPSKAPPSDIYINPAPGSRNTNSSISYYKSRAGLSCVFKYVYDSPSETYLKLIESNSKAFYITSTCSGNAKAEYYLTSNI